MGAHGRVGHRYQRGNVCTNTPDQLQARPPAGKEGGRGEHASLFGKGSPPAAIRRRPGLHLCPSPAARPPCQGGLAQPESWPRPRSAPASHVGWPDALRDTASLLWPWFHRPGLGDIPQIKTLLFWKTSRL